MRIKAFTLIVAVALVVLAGMSTGAQEKGVKTRGMVTSLGGFSAGTSTPLQITGAIVEIEPGGETGRFRHRVPTFLYIVDGILVTDTQGGPIGVDGVQYHGEGQSYLDPGNLWQIHKNTSQQLVKYIKLFIGYPGAQTVERPAAE